MLRTSCRQRDWHSIALNVRTLDRSQSRSWRKFVFTASGRNILIPRNRDVDRRGLQRPLTSTPAVRQALKSGHFNDGLANAQLDPLRTVAMVQK